MTTWGDRSSLPFVSKGVCGVWIPELGPEPNKVNEPGGSGHFPMVTGLGGIAFSKLFFEGKL